MGGMTALFAGLESVMIDTCCFIYHIQGEDYPEFAPSMQELFALVASGRLKAVTSPITVVELMSRPRRLGVEEAASGYKLLLTHFLNMSIPAIDVTVADKAAALRVLYGLKTPDALQVATGIVYHASAFITYDRDLLRASPAIKVIIPGE